MTNVFMKVKKNEDKIKDKFGNESIEHAPLNLNYKGKPSSKSKKDSLFKNNNQFRKFKLQPKISEYFIQKSLSSESSLKS